MSDDRETDSQLSDDALATMAQAGDLPAFNTLVERYQRPVFGLCLRMLSSAPAAEDVAQETFLAAWRGLERYRGGVVPSLDLADRGEPLPGRTAQAQAPSHGFARCAA